MLSRTCAKSSIKVSERRERHKHLKGSEFLCRITGDHQRSSDHPKFEGFIDRWIAEECSLCRGQGWEMVEIKSEEGLRWKHFLLVTCSMDPEGISEMNNWCGILSRGQCRLQN